MNESTLRAGGRYNWKNQAERLMYMGRKQYPGDRRTWHQFAKVEAPEVVWCEVLASDLEHFEETAPDAAREPGTLDPQATTGEGGE